jgi:orotate phosphoribosyltransferase
LRVILTTRCDIHCQLQSDAISLDGWRDAVTIIGGLEMKAIIFAAAVSASVSFAGAAEVKKDTAPAAVVRRRP